MSHAALANLNSMTDNSFRIISEDGIFRFRNKFDP